MIQGIMSKFRFLLLGGVRCTLFTYMLDKVHEAMSCCDDSLALPSMTQASEITGALEISPDPVVAAAMVEATQLSDSEREIILGVLGRDELLRREQHVRVLHLKKELQNLRRKGALKTSSSLNITEPDQDPDRCCRRCRVELGRVINRGAYCRACRLRVCKACRYSFRATDWVCIVCKKQMEIQAASGEWMNEFLKKTDKPRDNRVCLPTADIIKRTIRRSWTISNPTPRWSTMRGSPELRPYNSLPRKQDINNYPFLALHQTNLKNKDSLSPTFRRRSPRRTQSEDIYDDQGSSGQFRGRSPINIRVNSPESDVFVTRQTRVNPLINAGDSRSDIERKKSPMRINNEGSSEDGSSKEDGSLQFKGILTPESIRKFDRSNVEKRVSFESPIQDIKPLARSAPVLRTQSLIEGQIQNHFSTRYSLHHEDNSDNSEEAAGVLRETLDLREEHTPIELCEIEPFSGTVFRKMMVRRRRQNNARKLSTSTSNCTSAAENGWRRGPDSDLWDILLPEGDDYRLVFINSDSSSKEETSSKEEDDNDSSSTASSFPIDECDWDYFEPGNRLTPAVNWSSPFGSPRVYRRSVVESPIGSPIVYRRRMRESDTGTDEDNVRQDSGSPTSFDSIFQSPIIPQESNFSRSQLRNHEKMVEDSAMLQCLHWDDITKPSCYACGAPTQFIPIPVPVPIPFPVPALWPPHETALMLFGEQRFQVLPRNLWPYLSQAALIWPTLNANGGTTGTTMLTTADRDACAVQTQNITENARSPIVETEEEITGYLECENRYVSSSDSSSDYSDNSKARVRRIYNVSGTERHSDDALSSSNVSSDIDEEDGQSSVREDDLTSSGSDDTDSDDTGTVADQKSKRFSRIFIVNKNVSSSSNSDSSSNTDTSDNDTDTELDCTVILTHIKHLTEDIPFDDNEVCDTNPSDKSNKIKTREENSINYVSSSSPGLSDVSAESVNSSDVDQIKEHFIVKNQDTSLLLNSSTQISENQLENDIDEDEINKKIPDFENFEITTLSNEDIDNIEDKLLHKNKQTKIWTSDNDCNENSTISTSKLDAVDLPLKEKIVTRNATKDKLDSTVVDELVEYTTATCVVNNSETEPVACAYNSDSSSSNSNINDSVDTSYEFENTKMDLVDIAEKIIPPRIIENDEGSEPMKLTETNANNHLHTMSLRSLNENKTVNIDDKNVLNEVSSEMEVSDPKNTDNIEDSIVNEEKNNMEEILLSNNSEFKEKKLYSDILKSNKEDIEKIMESNNVTRNFDSNFEEQLLSTDLEDVSTKTERAKTCLIEQNKSEVKNDKIKSITEKESSEFNEILEIEMIESSNVIVEEETVTNPDKHSDNFDEIAEYKEKGGTTNLKRVTLEFLISERKFSFIEKRIETITASRTRDAEQNMNNNDSKTDEHVFVEKAPVSMTDIVQNPVSLINNRMQAISNESPLISDISCPTMQLQDVVFSGETPVEVAGADDQRAPSEWIEIRSTDAVNVEGNSLHGRNDGVQPGAIVCGEVLERHAARYTSLVMITQDSAPKHQQVNVVTSDTTTLVPGNDVVVRHTNWQEAEKLLQDKICDKHNQEQESVTVITGGDTLSAFEEGLADDDSWVENLSHEEDEDEFATNSGTEDSSSGDEVTLTCSAALDQEEDLRGYHRAAIDFTLHTIVEESCEESEVEQNVAKAKERPASATDLEKYFFFGLGDGIAQSLPSNREDTFSETSSIYSEGMESLGGCEDIQTNDTSDPTELASSRLEKYFLSGFMGFTAERRDSDGSVGSDSEGRPSPEQRRKRLVRARGTGRSHSSSLDNLDNTMSEQTVETQISSEDSSSSDSENHDETNSFEKIDGQFDTVKRKKNKKPKSTSCVDDIKNLEIAQEMEEKTSETDEDGQKTPQPETQIPLTNLTTTKNQQSRDSGFVGSCDDLLRDQKDNITPDFPSIKNELKAELENIIEEKKLEDKIISVSTPPATSLTRKDSFNNWSSDEETNLMMCKMRQFFKTMVANTQISASSKPSTPTLSCTSKPLPSPRAKRCKPPQLIYFENELTRLMKTVPGIREDQVREIVEYLSSEDTWSDSYDSSDYTSSDLEITTSKTVLQQQISDSCKQIINKFDNGVDDEGDEGDGGIVDELHGLNKETAFVYQKLVASFEKMASGDCNENNMPKITAQSSPPLIAKVMHHIGSRLVALMHEVSSGDSHTSNSPKTKHYHRRLQHKISSASSTTTEDDCAEGNNDITNYEDHHLSYNMLPRSRSHDLLLSETRVLHQSTGGVSDITEEKEASDCERFSWRGSFESALLATDSRNKLSLLGGDTSASALAIAAKRRSAGDLLFSQKSLSREQLDRVRSCGSIGGASSEDKLWITSSIRPNRRRSSVPDASCGSGGSADGEDEDEDIESRSTLPRTGNNGTTNSLPRLPTTVSTSNIQKSQSHHFLSQNVKSARYRPPGFNRITSVPKRAVSAPGLQPTHQRRGRRSQHNILCTDEAGVSEAHSSPMLASPRNVSKSATSSPTTSAIKRNASKTNQDWNNDEDLDRVMSLRTRASLSTLGARSDSMASVYSGAGEGRYGTVAVRGQVEFGLQYNYKAGALEIQIKQCKDLASVDAKRNRSDPYVKVYLLPDKSKSGKRKTKVKKHTLNPVFDECLKFHISLNGLETRTLWLTVWHSDMFGRNDFLGEVMMTLENKVFDDPTPKWYNLQERTEPFEDVSSYKGDIIVCLKFVPPDMTIQKKGKRSRGALHVLVKEAKSLAAVKANGTSDPFCKSYLLPDKGRSSKQKTHIAKRTTNPVWNHTFIYDDVTLQELAERCLELTVWDHDRLASNEFLGGVRFSLGTGKHYGKPADWMDASGRELSLWKNMLEKPNFWVEGSLSLRSSLESRGS